MCPCCGLAPYYMLGELGSKLWARCRWCGCDFTFDPATWDGGDDCPGCEGCPHYLVECSTSPDDLF